MNDMRKRETAKLVRIEDIIKGRYFKEEGFTPNYVVVPWGMRVSRARFVSTIVNRFESEDGTYGSLTFDDGTATIRGKFFKELKPMRAYSTGDIVEVIGKIREYNNEKYIIPEMMVKRNINWEFLRLLHYIRLRKPREKLFKKVKALFESNKGNEEVVYEELKPVIKEEEEIRAIMNYLKLGEKSWAEIEEGQKETEEGRGEGKETKVIEEENLMRKIMKIIAEIDTGEGADYAEVLKKSGVPEEDLEDIINTLLSDGTCYEPRPGKIKIL